MDIRNTKQLKTFALARLENARDEKRIVVIYSAIILGLSGLVMLADYLLQTRIDQFGGLRNMSIRTTLSAIQSMLPMVQSVVTLCLDLGFLAAMLRIARGQYASPQALRLGFDRFWVLLRLTILKSMLYIGIAFACLYLSIMIYMLTPLSKAAMEILIPLVSNVTILDSGIILDDATYTQLTSAMTPLFILYGILFSVVVIPLLYSLRMANYVVIDKPAAGALAALRESNKMMRRNRLRLFRLDLSLWWYFGVLLLVNALCYGDVIAPMVGIRLPWAAEVSYFVFFFAYLLAVGVAYYFLRNRVEVTYALAYDALKPKEKPADGGVVLGNIFQM